MTDPDDVVRRLAGAALLPIRRIARYVSYLTIAAIGIAVASLLLGMATLDGGARTVWVVLAVVFGWLAIARVVQLRWNIARLLRNRLALERELRTAIDQRSDSERVVIDLSHDDASGDAVDGTAMQIWTRDFVMAPGAGAQAYAGYRWIPLAVKSAKQLGIAAVATTFITVVFAVMALIFLIALAL